MLDNTQARFRMFVISSLPITDRQKDKLLQKLDIRIQNENPQGLASPVIAEILDLQYHLLVDDDWKRIVNEDEITEGILVDTLQIDAGSTEEKR